MVKINGNYIENVYSIKYLGFNLTYNLNNTDDINRVKNKFYAEFNVILRKFGSAHKNVKLFLFKQYCLQFYGCELWFGGETPKYLIKQFSVGFHKAIKKLLGLSSHESNHFACQEANVLMLGHFLNKLKISATLRFLLKPCNFISKILDFIYSSSALVKDVLKILTDVYDVSSLLDNDYQAILSRIWYVQNHEERMREHW